MPKGELVICENFTKGDGSHVLAYKFNVYAQAPVSRDYIYVDAKTGEVIHKNAIIKHVNATATTAATRYSGNRTITTDQVTTSSYRLRETTRGLGIETYNMKKGTAYASAVDFTNTTNVWNAGNYASTSTTKDNAALDAHWGAETTYDYWFTKHGRNSFDNAGAKIKSYVHFDLNYDNAYWDGTQMTYGDGSGTGGFNVLTALDVCGHEIGHAVCEKTANLVYSNESGAMNEGFSDIWGACIEAFGQNANVPNTNTWLIGENIEMRAGHVSLRSMSNPNAESQPDTYKGTYWYTGTADNGGVHTNSGVLNYWFYLLSMGGSGTNDISKAFSVTGLGIDVAAKIAFRGESVYLTSSSTYASARTATIQAATDLYGAGSAQVIATTKAWYAVGIGADYVVACTTPAVPAGLSTSALLNTSVTLNWTANGATSYAVQYKTAAATTWTATTSTTNSKAITGLVAGTSYQFQVAGVCTTTSAWSATGTFTTPLTSVTYGASAGTSQAYEWIDLVQLGSINRTSTKETGGYVNTGLATGLPYGAATITLSAGFTSTAYSEYFKVYIDYNKNGVFTDAGELVVNAAASTLTTNRAFSFTVPTTASAGSTRMRVVMSDASATASTGTYSYGETEDYTVNVGSAVAFARDENNIAEQNSVNSYNIYPNPASDVLNVQFDNLSENATVRIMSMTGAEVYNSKATGKSFSINVAGLSRGMYVISIADENTVVNHKFVKQ
jgi:Zn-dependent metalloprotease